MQQKKIEKIIKRAERNRLLTLNLRGIELTSLPESIGSLTCLTHLDLRDNQLTSLPESMGNLTCLTHLDLRDNQLTSLPESMGNLTCLTRIYLDNNQLTSLPESIENLICLTGISLSNNQLTKLPNSLSNLTNLACIHLTNNPLVDLSILKDLRSLKILTFRSVNFYMDLDLELPKLCVQPSMDLHWKKLSKLYYAQPSTDLPRRYWTKFSNWEPEWLLDENNAEIRQILIAQVGYEKICEELNAITMDTWREYTLLKIDDCEQFTVYIPYPDLQTEPMVLLKMTCPSTAHIHILRVPPQMVSAEEAITWVNHGIHPDKFSVQT
jgi:leucine-rich repeat protein SHOC2